MTSIVVIGTSGALGSPLLTELQNAKYADKIAYPIRAITTKDKSKQSNDKVKYYQGQLDDPEFAEQFVNNTNVVISLLQGSEKILVKAEKFLSISQPSLYIAPEFGTENEKVDPETSFPFVKDKLTHATNVRQLGIKTVCLYTSQLKMGPFLSQYVAHVGVDIEGKSTVYLKDSVDKADGNIPVQFTAGEDMVNCVATLALSDPATLLNVYRVYSDSIMVKDIVKEKEQEMDITITPIYKTLDEAIEDYKKSLTRGEFDFNAFMYLCTLRGAGHGSVFGDNEKEDINPGETLWKWGSW